MGQLAELNAAVRKLDDLWQACTDPEQKEEILKKRDKLDTQAAELADLILKQGSGELNDAIKALNELTEAAAKAKEEIERVGKSIEKVATTISKATAVAGKVAALIASL